MKTQIASKQTKVGLAAYWALLVLLQGALGGVPFNNLQGVGGAAFNPLAYPAGQNAEPDSAGPLSRPQFGAWYVNLGEVDEDWTTFGVAETLFNRLELSNGYELIAPAAENINFAWTDPFWGRQLGPTPLHLLICWGVLSGVGSGAVATVLGATVVNRWFKTNRGLVMGLMSASSATES